MKIRIRRIMVPVMFCLAVACLIEIPMAQTDLFGDAAVLWDTLFRAVIEVPVLYYFYKEDEVFRKKERWDMKTALVTAAAGVAAAVLLSRIVRLSGLPGEKEADEALYAGGIWLQAVVLLAASPILEELFFRGVFYQRLKELLPEAASVIITAAFFGVFHWNPAQGVYSFLMGILLCLAIEHCQTVKAPILLHMAANLAAMAMSMYN